MITTADDQVITVLDAICDQGCSYVDSCIEVLVAGGRPEYVAHLSEAQCISLLQELQAIMAVYHAREE